MEKAQTHNYPFLKELKQRTRQIKLQLKKGYQITHTKYYRTVRGYVDKTFYWILVTPEYYLLKQIPGNTALNL